MVAKGFALIDVAQMNFNSGNFDSRDRVANGNAGVRIRTWINHEAVILIDRAMNCIDKCAFVIRLQHRQLNLKAVCFLLKQQVNIAKCGSAINARFAVA